MNINCFKEIYKMLFDDIKVKSIKITFSNDETLIYEHNDVTKIFYCDDGYIDVLDGNVSKFYAIDQIVKIECVNESVEEMSSSKN